MQFNIIMKFIKYYILSNVYVLQNNNVQLKEPNDGKLSIWNTRVNGP